MGQVRQCAENLHRERLSQRAAREANQELMDQDTVRNSPGSDSLTGTFSSDLTEEAAGNRKKIICIGSDKRRWKLSVLFSRGIV